MSELILHHYDESPFSEKIRIALAYKGLKFRSVQQPLVAPKPDQTALTGGYRRAPVLQLGAHVFCDTALIAEVLERLQPEPALFPKGTEAMSRWLSTHIDNTLFRIASILVFQPRGARAQPQGMSRKEVISLLKDRAKMMENSNVMLVPPQLAPEYFAAAMQPFEEGLASSPYLCGAQPSIADFALHAVVWFLRTNENARKNMEPFAKVNDWADRMETIAKKIDALQSDLPSGEAVDLGKAASPNFAGLPGNYSEGRVDHPDFAAGDRVHLSAGDYGKEPVTGELVYFAGNEVAVRHTDERAGEMIVHFPIFGYVLEKAGD